MTSTTAKRPKTFVLKINDPAKIDEKYNFQIDFNLDRKDPPKHCTRIDRILPTIPLQPDPAITAAPPSSSTATTCGVASTSGGILTTATTTPSTVDDVPTPSLATAMAQGSLSSSLESSTIKVLHNNLKRAPFTVHIGRSNENVEAVFQGNDDLASRYLHIQGLEPWCTNPKLRDSIRLTFMDECKKEHQCVTTMLSSTKNDALADQTILHCYWCRHPFPYRPIGVPLSYVPNRVHKQYFSEITNDTYILRENINDTLVQDQGVAEVTEAHKKPRVVLQPRNYYISDGTFCSFNCALAFIREQRTNPVYSDSESLLLKIYHETYGYEATKLHASPSWRLLRNYGGHLTIEDFRRNLFKIDYKTLGNVVLPTFRPIGFLFERQVRI
jgi:hypothetical protein